MSSERGGFSISTLAGTAGPPGGFCQHLCQRLGILTSFSSPIPKTTPIGIALNPRLGKHNQQRVRKPGKPVTFQLFPPSTRRRGPLQKHLATDHPRAGMAATVAIRILPISLAKSGNGNG